MEYHLFTNSKNIHEKKHYFCQDEMFFSELGGNSNVLFYLPNLAIWGW